MTVQSRSDAPSVLSRTSTIVPSARKEPEKTHHDLRIRRSETSAGAFDGGLRGWLTSGDKDGGLGPARPLVHSYYWARLLARCGKHDVHRISQLSRFMAGSGGVALRARGVMATITLHAVQGTVRRRDQIG